ncbi:unnamed protein product [Ceutorhynchus assimilis]|uniref:Uncharacterized protein n=1 Tax=Ceutorhynchus assimilis TaxID=467358 RepID=A0A9N9MB89_9CUCU|nr:unnamed protein product [Ceutorhynchus assimilis]
MQQNSDSNGESPRPTAFTIDFDHDKKVDVQRHKSLAEKFQQRHKRGKSMSKLESSSTTTPTVNKKLPLTGNLPRKASFQLEDELPVERCKSANVVSIPKKTDLTLPLENITSNRMTHSFPNSSTLFSLTSPGFCDLQNISSPEFESISPFSPNLEDLCRNISLSSEEDANNEEEIDSASETGTYTLEVDNYSEEQKARMSIDNEFKIEKISVEEKTEEYIRSLPTTVKSEDISCSSYSLQNSFTLPPVPPIKSYNNVKKLLSPILSPTQNLSIIDNDSLDLIKPKKSLDEGAVISVSSSGAFRIKTEEKRRLSLTKSEIHVEAYIDGQIYNEQKLNNSKASKKGHLTANIVNVQSIEVAPDNGEVFNGCLGFGKIGNLATVTTGLPPPTPTGKTSPSKIPSPIHTLSRPRSRNSLSALPSDDFDTETILKPTRNYINSLQQKLSLDSDQDSDYEMKYGLQLNNTAHLLKQRALHIRHNSLDDRTINNKLEHFQNKQPIDQTYTNVFSQYSKHQKVVNKINNSPSNSPIRRSSSFSNRNQINIIKSTNIKDSNLCLSGGGAGSPSLNKNDRIQRSSSTACIKPSAKKPSEHKKIDRSQYGDTESSSEDDDLDPNLPNLQKKKDLGNLSNTRCNRTFSLRRARVDNEISKLKCPNTPDMRRKSFQPPLKPERAISVDRKPIKTNEVQSRYLLSLNKRTTIPVAQKEPKNVVAKPVLNPSAAKTPVKQIAAVFTRAEGGRLSMRSPKPAVNPHLGNKNSKKDGKNSKQSGGGRSNSSLSSREVEFQNWKRRKSYDPMKAAAEGKRKVIEKKLGGITSSNRNGGNASPESSPSHSGSVHRSQSFHGTAALEQLISSEEEEDATFSPDEGFSPPTPSPCEMSPSKANLRHTLWDRIRN